jgi:hypothetical protein
MKGWDYSRKEIFEINAYNTIFKWHIRLKKS